jgi:hypothetical protein
MVGVPSLSTAFLGAGGGGLFPLLP